MLLGTDISGYDDQGRTKSVCGRLWAPRSQELRGMPFWMQLCFFNTLFLGFTLYSMTSSPNKKLFST